MLSPPRSSDFFGFHSEEEEDEENKSTIEDAEIKYDPSDLIGEGNFGAVYKGYCRGAQVAVKVPKTSDWSKEKVEEFREELKVNAKIVHPRVVALLGAYIPRDYRRGQELKIVMELFGRSDIEKLLLESKKGATFTLFERVRWMKQVAEGMAWIHGAGIVHRDLKPSNVLYDSKTRAVKVCDFGLSVLLPKGNSTLLDPKGTPLYVAPELVTEGPTTHACDVFSYGIMGYVFVARQRPYDDQPELPDDIAEFLGCVVDGTRPWMQGTAHDFPRKHAECPESLRDLLMDCWEADFVYRPTFEQILSRFDAVLVDCGSPHSISGATFWKRKYVSRSEGLREEVPWPDFRSDFWKTFSSSEDQANVRLRDMATNCVKELICETKKGKEEVVTLETLGRTLGFLPSLRKGFFSALVELCQQPWFWGATDPKNAYKSLVPAKSRSFMVRFSSTPPNFTISFKEKGGNILHRRVIRRSTGEVYFENGDMCERAQQPFKSLPHLVDEMQSIMRWTPLPGGPYWWIFNEKADGALYGGGYNGYVSQAAYSDGEDDSSSEEEAAAAPAPPVRFADKHLKVLTKLRFLNRSGVITEVRGEKVQVLFADNERKEWVKAKGLLERAFVEK